MIELGLYPNADKRITQEERFSHIKNAGFDYVCASKISQLSEEGADSFLACAKKFSFPIENIHLTGKDTNLVWFEDKAGEDIIDRYCGEMNLAVKAGIPVGIVHVTWGFSTPPLNDIGKMRFARLIKHAEKIGFTICFENSVSLPHVRAILDNFDSPAVRFCFDSGHHNEFCRDVDILSEYRHLLRATHINDNDGLHDHHVIPFDGNADFTRTAKTLRGIKRLTFEVSGFRTKKVDGNAEEIFASNFANMAFSNDPRLLEVHDGGYSFYPAFSYEEYLERLMNAAKRLQGMIEE